MTSRSERFSTCEREECCKRYRVRAAKQRFCSGVCSRIAQNKGKAPTVANGFVIANGETLKGHPIKYIDIVYKTESAAREVLADLLKPYPAGHVWRHKLSVKPWDAKAEADVEVVGAEPPIAEAKALLKEVIAEMRKGDSTMREHGLSSEERKRARRLASEAA